VEPFDGVQGDAFVAQAPPTCGFLSAVLRAAFDEIQPRLDPCPALDRAPRDVR
jgi:hypothetical protein